MKLYFDRVEFKDWVDDVLLGGLFKTMIEDRENLLYFLFFFLVGVVGQILVFILSPISLILVLLMAIKIK